MNYSRELGSCPNYISLPISSTADEEEIKGQEISFLDESEKHIDFIAAYDNTPCIGEDETTPLAPPTSHTVEYILSFTGLEESQSGEEDEGAYSLTTVELEDDEQQMVVSQKIFTCHQ